MEKECLQCKTQFETQHLGKLYCSLSCASRAARHRRLTGTAAPVPVPIFITKACVQCHKDFETQYADKLYCSTLCESRTKRLRQGLVRTLQARLCPQCGTEFEPKTNSQKYCSERCAECGGIRLCDHKRQNCSRCSPQKAFKQYERSAKDTGRSFELTLEEFEWVVSNPCAYCGESEEPMGVDRVRSDYGYRFDNVQPLCKTCNRMKLDHTEEKFISHIKKIVHYQLRSERVIRLFDDVVEAFK